MPPKIPSDPRFRKERRVKELSVEEVLRIAGGVPAAAALDDTSYAAPAESRTDPADYARLMEAELRTRSPG
jgi:hypothetical protein